MQRKVLVVMALLLLGAALGTAWSLVVTMARIEACVTAILQTRAGLASWEAAAICERTK